MSSFKNRELKIKLWWVWAREKKESAVFVTLIFVFVTFILEIF